MSLKLSEPVKKWKEADTGGKVMLVLGASLVVFVGYLTVTNFKLLKPKF